MTEEEFIESIDARFPYENIRECKRLIEQGISISENSSFMVLHELCMVPKSKKVNRVELLKLVDHWIETNKHPVAKLVANIAKKILMDTEVSVAESMAAMEKIRPYKWQQCALSIPYMACDDSEGKADDLLNEIQKEWRSN